MPQKPLSLPPEKTGSPSAQRKRPWAAVFMVLILAGAAAWFWIGKDPAKREAIVSATREAVSGMSATPPSPDPAAPGASTSATSTPATPPTPATPTSGASTSGASTPGLPASGSDAAATPGQTSDGSQPGAQSGVQAEAQAAAQTGAQANGQSRGQVESGDAGDPARPGGPNAAGGPERNAVPSGQGSLPVLTAPATSGGEGQTSRGLVANEPQPPQDPGLAGRQDDAVVRPAFIDDLARWMVGAYTPPGGTGGRGSVGISIQSANARYGVGMKGLSWIGDDLPAGRNEALSYVYTPGMLDALYRLYIDRFMQAMDEASAAPHKNGKTLEPEHIAEMYRLYAGRLRALSGAMQGVAAIGDLRARVAGIQEAGQKTVAANTKYMEEVFAFDQAREGDDQALIGKTRSAMETASDAYLQTARQRDQLRDALIGAIRNNPGARGFSDDTLLYVALWIDRRLQRSPQALDASLQGATLFLDLAQRFESTSGVRP